MTVHSNTHRISLQAAGNKGIFARLTLAHNAWRQRRALERLDAAGLADIGISAAQRDAEASRPIWDVPNHWLR